MSRKCKIELSKNRFCRFMNKKDCILFSYVSYFLYFCLDIVSINHIFTLLYNIKKKL